MCVSWLAWRARVGAENSSFSIIALTTAAGVRKTRQVFSRQCKSASFHSLHPVKPVNMYIIRVSRAYFNVILLLASRVII